MSKLHQRRLPLGAEPSQEGGTHFRVWAPRRRQVEVVLINGAATELTAEPNGYFSGRVEHARPDRSTGFDSTAARNCIPIPCRAFNRRGRTGLRRSSIRRPMPGPTSAGAADRDGHVVYEMHVGTFTPEGTWAAAARQLPALADLGINVIEMMPVADFPGRFGWGYDGVNLYAPTRLYGTPDDLRAFIDRAHSLSLAVILDVVYNHIGPDGNYLGQFAEQYFTKQYKNEWGEALNFDGENSGPVREFFISNAGYWVEEYHFDGLRLDATQQIFDDSPEHVLAAINRRVRQAAGERATFIVAENEPQQTRLVRPPEQGGYGLDALWNDDFHHSARVALTGHNEAYYSDYHGEAQEFISAVKYGYLSQGQYYSWQKKRRGTPALDLAPSAFVSFIANHDQIANSGRGQPLVQLTSPGRLRAMTTLLLLGPATPMLFQGQEFASTRPFLFFADHNPDLARLVYKGRREFLCQFRALASPAAQALVDNPADPGTFMALQARRARARGAFRMAGPAPRPVEAAPRGPGLRPAAAARRRWGRARSAGFCPALLRGRGRSLTDRQPRPRPASGPGAGTVTRATGGTALEAALVERAMRVWRRRCDRSGDGGQLAHPR